MYLHFLKINAFGAMFVYAPVYQNINKDVLRIQGIIKCKQRHWLPPTQSNITRYIATSQTSRPLQTFPCIQVAKNKAEQIQLASSPIIQLNPITFHQKFNVGRNLSAICLHCLYLKTTLKKTFMVIINMQFHVSYFRVNFRAIRKLSFHRGLNFT